MTTMNLEAVADDKQFKTYTIEEVREYKDGWELHFVDGVCTQCTNEHEKQAPVPGEFAYIYGRGFAYPVRGIRISDRVYRYRTVDEADLDHAVMVTEMRRDRARSFEDHRAQFEADVAALPYPFRARIDRFRRKPGWDVEFGRYEMFACQEAVKIVETLKTADAVSAFCEAPMDKQKAMVPSLAYDEHSGNTFGSAKYLAAAYLADETVLARVHGALCPLVGCTDYGCWAVSG